MESIETTKERGMRETREMKPMEVYAGSAITVPCNTSVAYTHTEHSTTEEEEEEERERGREREREENDTARELRPTSNCGVSSSCNTGILCSHNTVFLPWFVSYV